MCSNLSGFIHTRLFLVLNAIANCTNKEVFWERDASDTFLKQNFFTCCTEQGTIPISSWTWRFVSNFQWAHCRFFNILFR